MDFLHKSDARLFRLRLRLLVAAVALLLLDLTGPGRSRILVNGLKCPVCMYHKDTPISCPLQPCASEQDFRASSAALLKDFGSLLAKHLVENPDDSGLTVRSGGGGRGAATANAGAVSSPEGPGPFYCFRVTGSVAAHWRGRNLNQVDDVIASGCSTPIDGQPYNPQDQPRTVGADAGGAALTAKLRFIGDLYTCDDTTATGNGAANCGENSVPYGVGVGPSEPTITEPGPELHCSSCLYKAGSGPGSSQVKQNSCRTLKCVSEEDYFKSSAIVFTDYMKLVSESFQQPGGPSGRKKRLVEQISRQNSRYGPRNRRNGGNSEAPGPFYCYSFTGKVSDSMGFNDLSLKNTKVIASGCSRPDLDHNVQLYAPSLQAHTDLSFKTTAFLSFDGSGYTCNKTVGVGPNCSPVTKKESAAPVPPGPQVQEPSIEDPSTDSPSSNSTDSTSTRDPYAACEEDAENGATASRFSSKRLLVPARARAGDLGCLLFVTPVIVILTFHCN